MTYYLQALNSLLIPAAPQLAGHEEEVAGLQHTVLSSQCIGVLLKALQAAEAACKETNGDAAVIFSNMHDLWQRWLQTCVLQQCAYAFPMRCGQPALSGRDTDTCKQKSDTTLLCRAGSHAQPLRGSSTPSEQAAGLCGIGAEGPCSRL